MNSVEPPPETAQVSPELAATLEQYAAVCRELWADDAAAADWGHPDAEAAHARFAAGIEDGGALEQAHKAVYGAAGGFLAAPPWVSRELARLRADDGLRPPTGDGDAELFC